LERKLATVTGDSGSVRLVLIGDVHHQWSEQDVITLKHLQPDVALFVGDFGEEVVELVQTIQQQVDAHNIPAADTKLFKAGHHGQFCAKSVHSQSDLSHYGFICSSCNQCRFGL